MKQGRGNKLWRGAERNAGLLRFGRAEHRAMVKHRIRLAQQAAEAQARYLEQAQLHAAEIRRQRGGSCERKVRYATKDWAERVRDRVKRERGVTLEIYPCPFCLGHHLTHETPDQVRHPSSVARSV